MRCTPCSALKGKKYGGPPIQDRPREGSQLRRVYDLFQANKGTPVEFHQKENPPNALVRLTDFYGLDIRKVEQGNSRTGRRSKYVLAGEWFGRVYVDYIAERVNGECNEQPPSI